jgi:hypothetical protein
MEALLAQENSSNMKTKKIKRPVLVAALLFAVSAVVMTAEAKPGFLAQAQQLGFPAKDCTYCHVNASGGAPWNARGNWMRAEKKKRGAKQVDVAWLKEYKGE